MKQLSNLHSRHSLGRSILKTLFFTMVLTMPHLSLLAQTMITGKVTDEASGEVILFGSVALMQDGKVVKGGETDINGVYTITDISPGLYDIMASYIGYINKEVKGVVIESGKTTVIDLTLEEGALMDDCIITGYKVPLIEMSSTMSGATVTAEAIKNLPSKNANAIAASAAGSSPQKQLSIRGSRSSSSIYYVDGIRVGGLTDDKGHEQYSKIEEYQPNSPFRQPLSTFAIDVDRASYSNVRRFLEDEELPPVDAVRIEEMVNYFNYDYPAPTKKNRPFEVYTQVAACPWNANNRILHVGIQGREIPQDDLPASNLVFLMDVSGSMSSPNKLPLVKKSFRMLLDVLQPDDRVAIVTYAGAAAVALPSTPVSERETILKALEHLESGGGTAGAQGIVTAYDIARSHFLRKGNNRVILATDGDFNVGPSSDEELDELIEKERESGIFLSVLGYGMGNYKDGKMQSLANKGNGNHSYIDGVEEAEKVLITEMGGTLHTIAKDVKVQIEFNPAYVGAYRLIGYENRELAPEDFVDDSKDAGELGSGHSVTALYEIYPVVSEFTEVDQGLVYQKRSHSLEDNEELATIKLRYKTPKGSKSWEIVEKISNMTKRGKDVDERARHAMAVAEFGLLLRKSDYRGDASYSSIIETLHGISDEKYMTDELVKLVATAETLGLSQ